MIYFAYGEDMDLKKMKNTCLLSGFAGTALLPDRELVFREDGEADLAEADDSVVGVLWYVSWTDTPALAAEKRTRGRVKETVTVYVDGNEALPAEVTVYKSENPGKAVPPDPARLKLIVEAAKYRGLPERWVRKLEKMRGAD